MRYDYYMNPNNEILSIDASIDDLAFDKYDIFENGFASFFCGTTKRLKSEKEATQTLLITRETRIVKR